MNGSAKTSNVQRSTCNVQRGAGGCFPVIAVVLLLGLLALGGTPSIQAQVEVAEYDLSWFTLDGGGGRSADGFFMIEATLGQPDAGGMGDDLFQLEGGFWPAALATEPGITLQPIARTALVGEEVTFNLAASGDLPLHYQWRLNGVNLKGETNATLVISSVQLTDGGIYTVAVFNRLGSIMSDPVALALALPRVPISNDFSNRVSLVSATGVFLGDNTNATAEAGEPAHAGKPGGRSVWFTWKAPDDGIATFRTAGSTFDTLLAVYLGSGLNTLLPVAANDDARGRYLTSEVRFNAVKDTLYQIAVDGLGGQQGAIVLSWDLEPTNHILPVITAQPASQAAPAGAAAVFTVNAIGNGLTYQWYFDGQPIARANTPLLRIAPVSAEVVGYYTVAITNDLGRGVESVEAALEIGPRSTVVSFNKLAEAVAAAQNAFDRAGAPAAPGLFVAAGAPAGFASVSVGGIGGQTYNNLTASGTACASCGAAGGVAQWFVLTAEGEGALTLDTIGSTFDTVLYVYSNAPLSQICAHFVGCNNDAGPTVTSSLLEFSARAGGHYLIGVDGVNGAQGTIQLNWKLCVPSVPFSYSGSDFILATDPNPAPYPDDPDYHWHQDGALVGTTASPTFAVGAPPGAAARFSVDYTSFVKGSVKLISTDLGSFLPVAPSASLQSGQYRITLTGLIPAKLRLETAMPGQTNCDGGWLWLPVTNYGVSTQFSSLVLTLPIEATNRLHRIRPFFP